MKKTENLPQRKVSLLGHFLQNAALAMTITTILAIPFAFRRPKPDRSAPEVQAFDSSMAEVRSEINALIGTREAIATPTPPLSKELIKLAAGCADVFNRGKIFRRDVNDGRIAPYNGIDCQKRPLENPDGSVAKEGGEQWTFTSIGFYMEIDERPLPSNEIGHIDTEKKLILSDREGHISWKPARGEIAPPFLLKPRRRYSPVTQGTQGLTSEEKDYGEMLLRLRQKLFPDAAP